MKIEWSPSIGPLEGKYVFLSASVPELGRDRGFLSGPLEDTLMLRVIDERVDDAVQSFVAQVLGAGGRVVHGGHPKIVRLIANQAGNWIVGPEVKEPPICIYQSAFYQHLPSPSGREEMEKAHLASIRWVSAGWEQLAVRSELPLRMVNEWLPMQAPESARPGTREALMAMRLEMLLDTKPVSGVCIGGMEGITAEAKLYLALAKMEKIPFASEIHVMQSTFGATGQLDGEGIHPADLDVHVHSLRTFTSNRIDRGEGETFPEAGNRPVSKETAIEDFQKRISYDSTMRHLVKSIANTRPR